MEDKAAVLLAAGRDVEVCIVGGRVEAQGAREQDR